ncbi:MAG: hypothetical protein J6C08_06725 [Campylobacter sp.]|uniref:hypothetical protein n=1 Tax=Campylobacter TaxID=194 RepID=UPI001B29BF42|nr:MULTISPECIES: hypothetical protein [Campylobacter]MBO5064190.1 hypothetical protein [Campylobacter sp.]MDL0095644.1 hypothetical protein [Campylobacter ovis]
METVGTVLLWIILIPIIFFAALLVINGIGGGIVSLISIIFGNEQDKNDGFLGVVVGTLMFIVGFIVLIIIF